MSFSWWFFFFLLFFFSRSDRASTSWKRPSPGLRRLLQKACAPRSRCPSSASALLPLLKDPLPPSDPHQGARNQPKSSSWKTCLSKSTLRHLLQRPSPLPQQPHPLLLLRHHHHHHHRHCHCCLPPECRPHQRMPRCLWVKKRALHFQPRTRSNKI